MVDDNEREHGKEALAKYGDKSVDHANSKVLNMSGSNTLKWKN